MHGVVKLEGEEGFKSKEGGRRGGKEGRKYRQEEEGGHREVRYGSLSLSLSLTHTHGGFERAPACAKLGPDPN